MKKQNKINLDRIILYVLGVLSFMMAFGNYPDEFMPYLIIGLIAVYSGGIFNKK